jgi:hypothetical protein
MDCSYTAVYDSYAKFCNMIGQPVLPFENWMHAREDAGTPKNQTKEFLETQVHA